MSEQRRHHDGNSGRDSKPVIFIFEGNNVLWMVLGVGLALLVFRLCHGRLHWSVGESIAAGLMPLVLATLYVVVLKSGKPPSYDREFFEWRAHQASQWIDWIDRVGLWQSRPYFAPCRAKKGGHHPFDRGNERNESDETEKEEAI
jgi:hypothetical protein